MNSPVPIRVGGYYVSEKKHLLRKIGPAYEHDGEEDFSWDSFDLKTGRATGDCGFLSARSLRAWATREATPEEVARLHGLEAKRAEKSEEETDMHRRLIQAYPDEMLLAEVRRRGKTQVNKAIQLLRALAGKR